MSYHIKQGESLSWHGRDADPEGTYYRTMNAHLQRKLNSLPPPRPVVRFKDMTPEKQEEMRRLYPPPPPVQRMFRPSGGKKYNLMRGLDRGAMNRDVAAATNGLITGRVRPTARELIEGADT